MSKAIHYTQQIELSTSHTSLTALRGAVHVDPSPAMQTGDTYDCVFRLPPGASATDAEGAKDASKDRVAGVAKGTSTTFWFEMPLHADHSHKRVEIATIEVTVRTATDAEDVDRHFRQVYVATHARRPNEHLPRREQ